MPSPIWASSHLPPSPGYSTTTASHQHLQGKENISSLAHCATCLRFKLKDEAKAKTVALKNHDTIVTVM